jgi:hypothetical protein
MQQKTLPVCVLHLIPFSKSTDLRQATGKLAATANFLTMRLCKYSKVPQAKQKQTKQLCLRNIVLIQSGKTTPHKLAKLNLANCVSITFERQKNDRKSDMVT